MTKNPELTFDKFKDLKFALQVGVPLSFSISSDSMHPVIKVGDQVVVQPLTEDLKVFDLLVFFQENDLVCHIFIKKSQLSDTFLTASYKYKKYDYPVKKENILGYVSSHRLSFANKALMLLKKLTP
jgi:hypothetical protein